MLLVADVGNTNTVFVVYDGDTVVDTIRTKTGDHNVKELTEKYYPVNMAFISSVVPSVNERLKKYLEYLYECEVKFLDSECDTGLKICTDAPEKTGEAAEELLLALNPNNLDSLYPDADADEIMKSLLDCQDAAAFLVKLLLRLGRIDEALEWADKIRILAMEYFPGTDAVPYAIG